MSVTLLFNDTLLDFDEDATDELVLVWRDDCLRVGMARGDML